MSELTHVSMAPVYNVSHQNPRVVKVVYARARDKGDETVVQRRLAVTRVQQSWPQNLFHKKVKDRIFLFAYKIPKNSH